MIKIIIIAILLVFLDKLITVFVIKAVAKKYPDKDKFSVEKNPLAQYFMKTYGLTVGSILYGIFSLFTFFFALWLLQFVVGWNFAFGILIGLYVLVILNNLRWLRFYS